MCGDLRTVIRCSQHPGDRDGVALRKRSYTGKGMISGKRLSRNPCDQIADLRRKIIRTLHSLGVECIGCPAVRPRCAAQAEINPARCYRIQNPELFGDFQGRVVGQHNAGAPDPDTVGGRADCRHDNFRSSSRYRLVIMVFGHPEAMIPQLFAILRQFNGFSDGIALGTPGERYRLVEYGETQGVPAYQLIGHQIFSRFVWRSQMKLYRSGQRADAGSTKNSS